MAQAELNSQARLFINELAEIEQSAYRSKSENSEHLSHLVADYDLIRINGEYHIGVLALVDENKLNDKQLKALGVKNDSRLGNLWTLRVPVGNLGQLISLEGIEYVEIGKAVSPDLQRELISTRVDSVHQGLGGLGGKYTGKGVIVGIIDWGFDYTHPTFYDTTLSYTRIISAWDQNKLSGPAPAGYSFGTEYIGITELLAAGTDTLYVFGPMSHGTHVAGIAGGTGAGTVHRGAAFEADLIFVSLRRDAPSLQDAFSYIANIAAAANKPFVINMSFGSHLGPHDGSSLENMGIDVLHGPGKIFVGSAGNNGDGKQPFHLDKDFSKTPDDTLKTVVDFWNLSGQWGQTLSMWGSPNSDFAVSVCMVNAKDSILIQTPFYNSLQEPFVSDTFLFGSDSLIIRTQSTAKHFLNDKPNIRLEVRKTGSNKIVLKVVSSNTHLHIWNNVRMNNRYTNWGVSLKDNYPGAVGGDNIFGVGEPGGVGKSVITIGSYKAEYVNQSSGTVHFGFISDFSSRGPTVDNRSKPDISSTGEAVISSVSSFDPSYNMENYFASTRFQDKNYGFVSLSGTSMSGPMVAGIVALMLQAFPKMSAIQAKQILRATARLDTHTGEIGEEGHLHWGWGKANALAAVKAAEILSSVEDLVIIDNMFELYPNPANDYLNIRLNSPQYKNTLMDIYAVSGALVLSLELPVYGEKRIDVSLLPAGSYLVKLQQGNEVSVKKMIIVK